MRGYREFRTITGKKVWTKMTRAEIWDRRLYWLQVVTIPLIMVWVFAKCAGMI